MADDELPAILTETVRDLDRLIRAAGVAAAAGDFKQLFQAAHGGRNLAMLVGAGELSSAFGSLTAAALERDGGRARAAAAHVSALWPATRNAIERVPGVHQAQSA